MLTYLYHSKVVGIEINEKRYQDALALTRLVNLTDFVSFYCDDILSINLPGDSFDVIYGQSSWNHIEDKNALIGRCKPLLDKNGCIVVEDVYCNINLSESSIILLKELEQRWQSYIVTKSKWTY